MIMGVLTNRPLEVGDLEILPEMAKIGVGGKVVGCDCTACVRGRRLGFKTISRVQVPHKKFLASVSLTGRLVRWPT